MSWLNWSIAFYVSEWLLRAVMLVVVTGRRRPTAAVTWLLVIFLFPWLGSLLYFLFANDRLPRRRVAAHARLRQRISHIAQRFRAHRSVVHPRLSPEAMGTVILAERLSHMPILGGNHVELMTETRDVVDRIIADIDDARHHVHLLFYIFGHDETGLRVIDALERATARGVTCRVLVDAVGSRRMLRRTRAHLTAKGIQVHEALPVGVVRRQVARIDLRNHRKLVVVDGRVGYTGSQNIIDPDYGRRGLVWHDMMARVTGPAVLQFQQIFIEDWYFDTGALLDDDAILPDPEATGDMPVQLIPDGPNDSNECFQSLVVSALHGARDYVTMTTPYFVPDRFFLKAMEMAVLRGVTVELIVPRRSDQLIVGSASRAYFEDLLEAGVRVFLFDDGLVHAKTITIDDDLALIGSSNLDIRSFALNFEINLAVYDAEFTRTLREAQSTYRKKAIRLVRERWDERPWAKKVGQNVAKLLSPLL